MMYISLSVRQARARKLEPTATWDILPALEFKDNAVGRKTGTERSQQETTVRAIGQGILKPGPAALGSSILKLPNGNRESILRSAGHRSQP